MKRWRPIYGEFDCPEKIRLKADELGIVIERGRKALATTEWPGENYRLCELVEEPDAATMPEEVRETIETMLALYWDRSGDSEDYQAAKGWLDSQ